MPALPRSYGLFGMCQALPRFATFLCSFICRHPKRFAERFDFFIWRQCQSALVRPCYGLSYIETELADRFFFLRNQSHKQILVTPPDVEA
jgi:hypothetical protein